MCHFINTKFCLLCFMVSCLVHSLHGAPPTGSTREGRVEISTPKYDALRDNNKQTVLASERHKHYHEISHGESNHADHGGIQLEQSVREQNYFLEMIFNEYGVNGVINFKQFSILLKNIGLDVKDINKSKNHDHDHDHKHSDNHDEHEIDHGNEHQSHDSEHNNHVHDEHKHVHEEHSHHEHAHDEHDNHEHHEHNLNGSETGTSKQNLSHSDSIVKRDVESLKRTKRTYVTAEGNHVNHSLCLESANLLSIYHYNTSGITQEHFMHLCPALIVQLDKRLCNHHHHVDDTQASALKDIPPEVWGYSIASVVVISLVGLLGVAVIPIMQKVFYNHLLQFLVALAVGALSGDAFLHLIPHALQENHSSHDDSSNDHSSHGTEAHKNGVYKGLCGLAGIYFFFLMERLLTILTDIKRKSKKRKTRAEGDDDNGGEKCMKALATHKDASCKEKMMVIHPGNKALQSFAEEAHHQECVALNKLSSNGNEDDLDASNTEEEEVETNTVLTHSHHHHSHGSGHKVPQTVAAIAWMVILGDGIHNFGDGLAVGAAFASSITGGFSTSIAVFCHELPHEIGDFAVLLRAGMKPKQAIIYNCISSVLCFFGMIIGVALGNIDQANSWIFIVIAGIFLYIALVDMLPEMTSVDTKQGEHPFCHLLFQISGMILGASIMLIIAIYEQDLMNVLET